MERTRRGGQERFLEEGNNLAKKQKLIRQRKEERVFKTNGTACVKGTSSKRIQNIGTLSALKSKTVRV